MIRYRFFAVLPALAGALLLASGGVAAQQNGSSWQTGDVFVGIGDPASGFPGHYRLFTPQGVQKGQPDLVLPRTLTLTPGIDVPGDDWGYTTGCAVDRTVPMGDLFATSWNGVRVGRFRQADNAFAADGSDGGGFEPLAQLPSFVASAAFNPNAIVAAPDIPIGNPLDDIQEIESIAFDAAGNYYLGTLIELQSATDVPKHYAWLLKYSKAGAMLGAWRVPAGQTGVDWIDVSNDQTTVYYTSEDKIIRWINTAAQTDGTFAFGQIAAPSLGSNPSGIRLLPPGDGSGGFLVATFDGVYRLDPQGHYIRSYADAANHDGGYFAMSLTPDGQYFWTATLQEVPADPGDPSTNADVLPTGGRLYKFHIASGAKTAGPLDTGSRYANGLCVVREYVAAQNVCYVMDTDGNAVTAVNPGTGLEEPQTEPCRAIPVCAAGDVRPECLPPGAPVLQLQDVTDFEGDPVDLQLQAMAASALPLAFTVSGAPLGICAADPLGDCPLQVSSAGHLTGRIGWHAFTGNPASDADTAYTVSVSVRSTDGDVATGTFAWHVKSRNGPPVIMTPGDQTLPLLKTANVPLVARDPDAATDVLTISASGLPPGMSVPSRTWYGMGWALALTGTPTQIGTFHVTVSACDCDTGGSHTAVSTTFLVTVRNLPPVFSVAGVDQRTLAGTPVAYQLSAQDPDHHDPVRYSARGLPAGLSINPASGLISGVPHAVGTTAVVVTASDALGASTPTTFRWTVFANRAPVCSGAAASPAVIWPPNHKLVPVGIAGVTDPDGDRVSIVINSITQDQPVDGNGDGRTRFDGSGIGTTTAHVRAERTGDRKVPDAGRLYQISFTASDGKAGGTCTGTVLAGVPHDQRGRRLPADNGCRWNSVTGQPLGVCTWTAPKAKR